MAMEVNRTFVFKCYTYAVIAWLEDVLGHRTVQRWVGARQLSMPTRVWVLGFMNSSGTICDQHVEEMKDLLLENLADPDPETDIDFMCNGIERLFLRRRAPGSRTFTTDWRLQQQTTDAGIYQGQVNDAGERDGAGILFVGRNQSYCGAWRNNIGIGKIVASGETTYKGWQI